MASEVLERMKDQAREAPKRIVFPEGEDPRVIEASRIIFDSGYGMPILIGSEDKIKTTAADLNIPTRGLIIISPGNERIAEKMAKEYVKKSNLLPESIAKKYLMRPLNFGAMMVSRGDADAMIAGLVHATEEVILASTIFIGLQEGIETASSLFLMEIPGFIGPQEELVVFADCGVVPHPSIRELADIAITTADTTKALLGWEPRIAMLSFSTKGSAQHEDIDKVLQAMDMVLARRPDILIDGELQLDAAIIPEVAEKKVSAESQVAGKANILIFPDLTAGNIAYKAVQRFARANAYGPYLQGFQRAVSDLSRASTVEDVLGVTTMAVLHAQKMSKKE